MKKVYAILATMVLTVSVLTGCGCRNSAPANTSEPALMPTMESTVPTTQATTEATTRATSEPTNATIEDGNGPISTDSTAITDPMGAGSGNGITGSIG